MKNCKWTQTAVRVVSVLVAASVVVLGALQVFDVWDGAISVVCPLLGISNLCQVYTYWEKSRKVAYFSLVTAILIFICSAIVFFIR